MGDENLEMSVESVWEKTRRSHKHRHYAGSVTALATSPPVDQELSGFDTSLQLGQSEPLGAGVKRVTLDQLEYAAGGFFDAEIPFTSAVHESRKSVKRVRAILRLVRGELPEHVFDYENRRLGDNSRMISEVRSADAVTSAAHSITEIYGELLADETFDDLILRLERRRDVIELRAREDPATVERVVRGLEKAYHRYSSWPTDPEAREVYGIGIRDNFAALEPGLTTTYRSGRHSMVQAYKKTETDVYHSWRKRVKDLRHQFEFLSPLWPEVVVGTAMTLQRLGDVLGDDNDLSELVKLVDQRHDLCPNPRERSMFKALARQRQIELRVAAEILGRRVYAEKPASMTGRFAEYWDSRQMALGSHLDTIVVY